MTPGPGWLPQIPLPPAACTPSPMAIWSFTPAWPPITTPLPRVVLPEPDVLPYHSVRMDDEPVIQVRTGVHDDVRPDVTSGCYPGVFRHHGGWMNAGGRHHLRGEERETPSEGETDVADAEDRRGA